MDGPAAVEGTWDRPIVIAALPYTAAGDTRAASEVRAERYDCAPAIDERGAELVYRLDLAAPTIVTIAVATVDATTDVDVHVVRAAATGALATGCLTRDDLGRGHHLGRGADGDDLLGDGGLERAGRGRGVLGPEHGHGRHRDRGRGRGRLGGGRADHRAEHEQRRGAGADHRHATTAQSTSVGRLAA